MPSFTETATLRVVDQSTAQIRKINLALQQLNITAKRLKVSAGQINLNTANLTAANRQLNALAHNMRQIGRHPINMAVNTAGLAQAQQRINQLRAAAARPIHVNVGGGGRGAGIPPGGGGGFLGGGIGGRRPRTPEQALTRGFVSGLGTGMSDLILSYGAVAVAGYAAAKALHSVADAAAKRDRTSLQLAVAATDAQRKIIETESERRRETPLPTTVSERRQLYGSLLGDVPSGMEKDKTLTREQRDVNRARAAVLIGQFLEDAILPRIYALNPEKGREGAQEGLRTLIKGANLASDAIVEFGADGVPKITKRAEDIFAAMQKAMQLDPELKPQQMWTALAGAKTAAYTLGQEGLIRMFLNVGARGTKAANELNQAMRSGSGIVDVKMLNNQLAAMGLIEGYDRATKTVGRGKNKKKVPGNVVTGTGRAVGAGTENDILVNPAGWFNTYFRAQMEKDLKKQGLTTEGQEGIVNIARYVDTQLRGMKQTALQAVKDILIGEPQTREQLDHINSLWSQSVPDAVKESWVAQAENVATAWKDAAARVGDEFIKAIGGADLLKRLEEQMREHPYMTVLGTTAGAIGALGIAAKGAAGVLGLFGGGAAATAGGAAAGGAAAAGAGVLGGLGVAGASFVGGYLGYKAAEWEKAGEEAAGEAEMMKLALAYTELNSLTQQLTAAETALAAARDPADIAQQATAVEKLKAGIAAINEQINQLGAAKYGVEIAAPPVINWISDAVKQLSTPPDTTWIQDLKKTLAGTPLAPGMEKPAFPGPTGPITITGAGVSFPGPTGPITVTGKPNITFDKAPEPTPGAAPGKVTVTDADRPAWMTEFTMASQSLASISPELGKPIVTAADLMAPLPNAFSSVFSTGATAIGGSGQTAANSLIGAAPGIGATIGREAGAAIQAAVSNMNINVNANVKSTTGGADTGTQQSK